MPPENPPSFEYIVAGSQLQLPLVESVATVSCRNASRITWHQHRAYECIFILEGATEYEFANQAQVALTGGHFLIVPRQLMHRGLQDVRRPVRLASILLHPSLARRGRHSPFTLAELLLIEQSFQHTPVAAHPMSGELRRLTQRFAQRIRDFHRQSLPMTAALRLLICDILLETIEQLRVDRQVPVTRIVRAAIEYMENHYHESISMEDVASAINCSRSRLFQAFKSSTGQTPNDFLQRLRVARAAELLKTSDMRLIDIALECGFATSQYFSFVFSKYYDLPPKHFREARYDPSRLASVP